MHASEAWWILKDEKVPNVRTPENCSTDKEVSVIKLQNIHTNVASI